MQLTLAIKELCPRYSRLFAYLLATLNVGIATLLRWLLDPVLGDEHPLIIYYGALAVTAWYGGWWPAVYSLVLSYFVSDWFFIPPRRELSVLAFKPAHWVGFGSFMVAGTIVAMFSEVAKRARSRAEFHADLVRKKGQVLEHEVAERSRAEVALTESQERLRLAMEAARMVAWKWDCQSNQTFFSSNVLEVVGTDRPFRMDGALLNSNLLHPDDLQRHREILLKAVTERSGYVCQFRVIRPDSGVTIWLEDRGKVISDSSGDMMGISGIMMDVTQRKQDENQIEQARTNLEKRVQERTAELAATNKELEAFSYSVSHDLRSPLRNINAFAELLKEHGEGKFDEDEKEMLSQVIQSTYRMEELIQDLLSLSRVSRASLHPKPVDLSFLVRHILSRLQAAEPRRTVELLITPNIKAQGDEGLLRIALENLLNNAWKFTRRCVGSRIEFGAKQYNGRLVYFVHDNGAGFDMADAGKLFGTFQRLHSDEDFPGTGIGLATVQRIIHRHGGKIWADGKPNQGATFYFTLSDAR